MKKLILGGLTTMIIIESKFTIGVHTSAGLCQQVCKGGGGAGLIHPTFNQLM